MFTFTSASSFLARTAFVVMPKTPRKPVQPQIVQPEIQQSREGGGGDRDPQGREGGGDVDVEDLLRQPLARFSGRVVEREPVHPRGPEQGQQGEDPSDAEKRACACQVVGHSSITAPKRRRPSVTKTRS